MAYPIKLNGSGILKTMDTTEFSNLAAMVLEKVASDDDVGSIQFINDDAYSNTWIGAFIDTNYEIALDYGTTGELIPTSNVKSLYQNLNTPTGDDPPRVFLYDNANSSLRLTTNEELDDLANSIVSWGVNNEGPNSYQIATSAPSDGGTWISVGPIDDEYGETTPYYTGAESYTKTNFNNNYLYKKISSVSYTIERPLKSNGEGKIQKLTDTEIESLSKKVKDRIVNGGIGQYRFQQSSPTTGGTWVSKGSVEDTRGTPSTPATYNDPGSLYTGPLLYESLVEQGAFYDLLYTEAYTTTPSYVNIYDSDVISPGLPILYYNKEYIDSNIFVDTALYHTLYYTGDLGFGGIVNFIGVYTGPNNAAYYIGNYSGATLTFYLGPAVYYQSGVANYTGKYYIGSFYQVSAGEDFYLGLANAQNYVGPQTFYVGKTTYFIQTNYLGQASYTGPGAGSIYYTSGANTSFYQGLNNFAGNNFYDVINPDGAFFLGDYTLTTDFPYTGLYEAIVYYAGPVYYTLTYSGTAAYYTYEIFYQVYYETLTEYTGSVSYAGAVYSSPPSFYTLSYTLASYQGPGLANYLGADTTYTTSYILFNLLLDSPVSISTVTLWRRIE